MINTEKKNNFNLIRYAVLTVMYTVAYNSYFRSISILWYGVSLLSIFVLAASVLVKRDVKMNFFVYWAIVFYMYTVLSTLWSINPAKCMSPIMTLSLLFVVGVLMSLLFDSREELNALLFINFLALLFCALYILLTVDPQSVGEVRIGMDTVGKMWNSNDIGLKMCVGLGIALYLFYRSDKAGGRIFYLVSCFLFVALALLTGSRKALLMIFGIVILFVLIKSRGLNRVFAILFILLFSVGLYFLIMNFEPLYNVIGKRFENMIAGLFGGGTDEYSFNVRARFIEYGLKWFGNRPLLGYGIGNFSELSAAQFGEKYDTYAHNNFVEMLVDGGIVGFFIYYSAYLYIIVKLLPSVFIKRDLTAILLFTLNIVSLVLQVALVSYSSTLFTALILFSVIYIESIGRERRSESMVKS